MGSERRPLPGRVLVTAPGCGMGTAQLMLLGHEGVKGTNPLSSSEKSVSNLRPGKIFFMFIPPVE